MTKVCKACNCAKPREAFSGTSNRCKPCFARERAEHRREHGRPPRGLPQAWMEPLGMILLGAK